MLYDNVQAYSMHYFSKLLLQHEINNDEKPQFQRLSDKNATFGYSHHSSVVLPGHNCLRFVYDKELSGTLSQEFLEHFFKKHVRAY